MLCSTIKIGEPFDLPYDMYIGGDNADIIDPYIVASRKAWYGRALVVIRSTKKAGDIKLTVSSDGLTVATATINAQLG